MDWVSGAVVLLIPIGMLFVVVRRLLKAKASLVWPSTGGQIVTAGTRFVAEGGSDNYGTVEVPEIRYKYSVDGVEYKGERLSYGASVGSIDSFVYRYQPESSVTVYYNPSKPSEAVLVPGAGRGNYLIIAWILFLTLLVILVA